MFSFVIEAQTAQELREKVAQAAAFFAVKADDSVPVSQSPAVTAEEKAAVVTPAAEKAPTPEELRTKIRQLFTPLMSGDRASDVTELVKVFGGSISKVPDDKLEELLKRAEELA